MEVASEGARTSVRAGFERHRCSETGRTACRAARAGSAGCGLTEAAELERARRWLSGDPRRVHKRCRELAPGAANGLSDSSTLFGAGKRLRPRSGGVSGSTRSASVVRGCRRGDSDCRGACSSAASGRHADHALAVLCGRREASAARRHARRPRLASVSRGTRSTAWGISGNIAASAAMGNEIHSGRFGARWPAWRLALRSRSRRRAAGRTRPAMGGKASGSERISETQSSVWGQWRRQELRSLVARLISRAAHQAGSPTVPTVGGLRGASTHRRAGRAAASAAATFGSVRLLR